MMHSWVLSHTIVPALIGSAVAIVIGVALGIVLVIIRR